MLTGGPSFSMLLSLAIACKHVPKIASRNLFCGKLVFRGLITVTLSNFLSGFPDMKFSFISRKKWPTQEILP